MLDTSAPTSLTPPGTNLTVHSACAAVLLGKKRACLRERSVTLTVVSLMCRHLSCFVEPILNFRIPLRVRLKQKPHDAGILCLGIRPQTAVLQTEKQASHVESCKVNVPRLAHGWSLGRKVLWESSRDAHLHSSNSFTCRVNQQGQASLEPWQ